MSKKGNRVGIFRIFYVVIEFIQKSLRAILPITIPSCIVFDPLRGFLNTGKDPIN